MARSIGARCRRLRAPARSTRRLPPRTETEQRLAAIWQEVLRVERIGVNDNFFDLGGHSLLATQVISRAREAFGLNVALANLFDSPTVAGLAVRIPSC